MEIVNIKDGERSSNKWLIFIFQLIAFCTGVMVSYNDLQEGDYSMLLAHLVSTSLSVMVIPIACNLGNRLRIYLMPSRIITSGALETLSKRIFWSLGPQSIVMFWTGWIVLASPQFFMEDRTAVAEVRERINPVVRETDKPVSDPLPHPEGSPSDVYKFPDADHAKDVNDADSPKVSSTQEVEKP